MVRRKSRRANRWTGWSKIQPRGKQRKSMRRKCGKKCFLGPRGDPTGFPICAVHGDSISCEPSDKGLWAAYLRAKQLSGTKRRGRRHGKRTYTRIARTARRMLEDRGKWTGMGGGVLSGTSTTVSLPHNVSPTIGNDSHTIDTGSHAVIPGSDSHT
jgi:hypothetical protein